MVTKEQLHVQEVNGKIAGYDHTFTSNGTDVLHVNGEAAVTVNATLNEDLGWVKVANIKAKGAITALELAEGITVQLFSKKPFEYETL